jgi:hypothetical protein
MMQSTSRVRRIIERDGQTLVSFDAHSAYFHAKPDIAEALRQAEAHRLTVHFTYDADLNIVGVVAHNG